MKVSTAVDFAWWGCPVSWWLFFSQAFLEEVWNKTQIENVSIFIMYVMCKLLYWKLFVSSLYVKEFLWKRLNMWHLDNSLIKFIHKTFTCLQTEMYLITFTKANYSHTTSTSKSVIQRKPFAFVIILKVILCASEHICSIVRYCFRSFKQL